MTSPPSRNPSGCASVRECHPSRLIHALGRTYVLRDGSFAAEGCVDLHWLTVLGDHRSERDPWISRVSRPTVLIGHVRLCSGVNLDDVLCNAEGFPLRPG